jgi:hypothetical protein
MSLGPIIIFDKSAFHALSDDESVWLDALYMPVITPLFFVETLADLEKEDPRGRAAEKVVADLAEKTPTGARPTLHHRHLCIGELLGGLFEMREVPVLAGGQPVRTKDKTGVRFEVPPEMQALYRWQRREFLDVERQFAGQWRAELSGIDLASLRERYRPKQGKRLATLADAKAAADGLVCGDGRRYATLLMAMDSMRVPETIRRAVIKRWKEAGGPPLPVFAPYTAHVVTVDLFFNFAIGSDLIGHARQSNKVDIAYLYYLPFCMVFASFDRLHRKCVPLFLNKRQEFIWGEDLKIELAKLDAHFSLLPQEVRDRGVMAFAHNPPTDIGFLTTRLWDRFLPKWRENLDQKALSPEAQAELVEHVKRADRDARPIPRGTAHGVDSDNADFTIFKVPVPMRRGKWALLPPEVLRKHGDEPT